MIHTSDHCHTHATIEPGKPAELPSRRTIVVALASAAAASSGPAFAKSEASPEDERFMRMALDEARQGDYAFGCVITRDGAVIAHGHNLGKTNDDPTAHGEMVAMPGRSRQRKLARRSDEAFAEVGFRLAKTHRTVSWAQRSMKWCAAEPGPFPDAEFGPIPDLRCTSNSAFTRVDALLRAAPRPGNRGLLRQQSRHDALARQRQIAHADAERA